MIGFVWDSEASSHYAGRCHRKSCMEEIYQISLPKYPMQGGFNRSPIMLASYWPLMLRYPRVGGTQLYGPLTCYL